MLPWFTKKSPGQHAHTRVADRETLQFSRLEESLQPLTVNVSLAYKHKNSSMNNNVSLRGAPVDTTHFAAVCTTRACA